MGVSGGPYGPGSQSRPGGLRPAVSRALLRTGELLRLTHRRLVIHDRGHGMSVILPGSKTSQGNPQVVLVQDRQLVSFARSILAPRRKDLLWPAGPRQFRVQFAKMLTKLGFAPDDYSPYSLRRGGTTWFFQSSLSMDATVARGRWSCSKTAKQYTDEGTSQLAQVFFTPLQRSRIRLWWLEGMRLRQEGRKWKRQ